MNSVLSQQDRNLNCWQTGEVSARTSRTLQSCALHTNSALCCCLWLLISKAFSSQCLGNIDHNKTRLHYLFRAATMSSCNLTGTLTILIFSFEIQTISDLLHFKRNTGDAFTRVWHLPLTLLYKGKWQPTANYARQTFRGGVTSILFITRRLLFQQCFVQKFEVFCNNSGKWPKKKLCSRCWSSERKYATHMRPKDLGLNQHLALNK